MPTLEIIATKIDRLDAKNDEAHERITEKLEKNTIDIACIMANKKLLRWLLPTSVSVAGLIITVVVLVT